jgi:hypothetical protein
MYQLKITIRDISPPVWRRLVVPGSITLDRLHGAIQTAFGWEDCHLHEFVIDGKFYGTLDEESGKTSTDEREKRLADVVKRAKSKFVYHYDFGDDWRHDIVVEKLLPWDGAAVAPECTAGKRHGPPEDSGGPWGYAELLDALSNRKHDRYREMREWMGGPYDPEAFSLDKINKLLQERFTKRARAARTRRSQ